MQLFRPIEHAITEDSEWVTAKELPVDYMGRLKCDGCHASVVVIENKSSEEEFVHLRHNLQEITRTRSCRYAIRTPAPIRSPGTGMATSSHFDSTHTTNWTQGAASQHDSKKMELYLV